MGPHGSSPQATTVRPAVPADEPALGRLGAALMRQHHAADARRFLQVDRPEAGYGRFLAGQLDDPDACVLVAERAGEVVGYVFAGLEPTSWRDLRGPCGFVHDAQTVLRKGCRGQAPAPRR